MEKHKLDLSFGYTVLQDENLIETVGDRMDYGQERWNAFGMVNGKIYAVTYVDQRDGPHFISVRSADRHETDIHCEAGN